jgi:nicotinamidase-related amidase
MGWNGRLLVALSDSQTAPSLDASALITIDTQRDLLDDGAFPIAGTSAVLPAMRRLIEGFRAVRRPIVHIVRLYEPDGSNAEPCRRELLAAGAQILIRGTPGCQIATELLPEPDVQLDAALLLAGRPQSLGAHEVALYKPRWGAFYRTPLEKYLRERGISTVVFAGCNFPNCPRTSIYEASERDFRVVAIRDAISGLYERGERELLNIGVQLLTAEEVTSSVRSVHGEPARVRS